MIRVITFAWGSYTWLIKPFLTCLERHWMDMPKAITVISDDTSLDLPEHVEFFDVSRDWRPALFSDRLRDVLSSIDEPIAMITGADRFLISDIPEGSVEYLAKYMVGHGNIIQCGLAHMHALHGHCEKLESMNGHDIVRCIEPSHCSLAAGIRMDMALASCRLLYSVLQPFWDVWKVETYGTRKVLEDESIESVAVHPGLFQVMDLGVASHGQSVGFRDPSVLDEADTELILAAAPRDTKWI